MSFRKTMLSFALAAMISPALAVAQDQGGDNGGGGRGNRGGGDRTQMREQYIATFKTELGVSDEEWTVLQPKIEKVTTAQRATYAGRGWGGGRGGDNNADDANQTPLAKASSELRAALANKDTSPDEIVKKLTALREARAAAEASLEAARKELKEVVTPRQEAVLVTRSILQ